MNSPHRKCQASPRQLEISRRETALHIRSPQVHQQGTMRHSASNSIFARVYAIVRRVPRGHVVTYGQVARALGAPGAARTVGWAMRVSPESVPWHRVVNARGEISLRPTTGYHEQRARLKVEGVRFNRAGRIDLEKYGWKQI